MRHHRSDVVACALDVLDAYGLADLTMRRLGSELGVQPSALYHHFPNKQALLAAAADELLRRGARPVEATAWDEEVRRTAGALRDAMLAYRDGAELVATVMAFGIGAGTPYDDLAGVLTRAGLPADLVSTAARTVLHFVIGHTLEEQTQLQAASAGAIDAEPRGSSDFGAGLQLILDGIRVVSVS